MHHFFILFLLISCSHKHINHNHQDKNVANQHMHKKTHEELIRGFDDPARDVWQKPQRVLELLGDLKGKQVIDIGSGSGYFTKYFIKANSYVTAADVDQKFLDHIEKTFPKKVYPRLSFSKIEYDDPKMKEGKFDLAFTSNTYHHIENRIEYLKKVRTGLKTKGRLAIIDFKANYLEGNIVGAPMKMRLPVEQVVTELLAAEFDNIQIYVYEFPQQYLVLAQKTK